MFDFKFFSENPNKIPKTIEEVRTIVTEQCILLYGDRRELEVTIQTFVDEICRHLNITN